MKKPKAKTETRSSSMYPGLHSQVSDLLAAEQLVLRFNSLENGDDATHEFDTNIQGRFVCRNKACDSSGWGSKRIPITIRMYRDQQYNATVYHQRCKACDSLSRPILDGSYAERVAYRIKKWSGVEMELPPYSEGESKLPHRADLCEGCKSGHCRELLEDL